jgi:hypothetical protein
MGLRLTPAERLRWLEETMEALRRWQGRARQNAPAAAGPQPRDADDEGSGNASR